MVGVLFFLFYIIFKKYIAKGDALVRLALAFRDDDVKRIVRAQRPALVRDQLQVVENGGKDERGEASSNHGPAEGNRAGRTAIS